MYVLFAKLKAPNHHGGTLKPRTLSAVEVKRRASAANTSLINT